VSKTERIRQMKNDARLKLHSNTRTQLTYWF